MRMERDSDEQWSFRELVPFELALLREIPQAARANGNEQAQDRLFPPLFIKPEHKPGGDDEWSELAHPSLRSAFESALQTVQEDLDEAEKAGAGGKKNELWEIVIPTDHADVWLSGLNQARLSLAIRFDLYDDNDEPRPLPEPPATLGQQMQWRAALQTELYGYVMEWILEHLME